MPTQKLTLRAFLPYQLSITSNAVSDLIARAYRGKFALKVPEWRVMALLGKAKWQRSGNWLPQLRWTKSR